MDIPVRFLPTQTIAADTFLIRQIAGEGLGPVAAMLNSMVIRGAEPVIVDTGVSITAAGWQEKVYELVDPADVRWIFLSHDDNDHIGSLFDVLEASPKATLVTNWFSVERMAGDRLLPLDRLRLVNGGESFEAGDRTFQVVVPPNYDSPTTRGIYDPTTGVYWAGDAFAAHVPGAVDDIDEFEPGFFRETFLQTQALVSPWTNLLDPVKYQAKLDSVRSLGIKVAAGAHGPALHGAQVDSAFELYKELPYLPPVQLQTQADLDVLLQILGMAPATV